MMPWWVLVQIFVAKTHTHILVLTLLVLIFVLPSRCPLSLSLVLVVLILTLVPCPAMTPNTNGPNDPTTNHQTTADAREKITKIKRQSTINYIVFLVLVVVVWV